MGLEISPVTSERDLETFLRVPALLRPENHVNKIPGRWVRPLLDRRTNPYFRHTDHVLFLARRDGRLVGRVAVFVDHLCNRAIGERAGSFGLFDCVDSPRVAAQILEAAERWLIEREIERVRGPMGPAMRASTGVLVEGHGQQPMPGLTFDPPELAALIEGAGYQPVKDLHAWRLGTDGLPPEVVDEADAARRRPGVALRPFRVEQFNREIEHIWVVLNDMTEPGRACAPWTRAEVRWMARKLFLLVDPSLVILVEQAGVPAAVALGLRNVRELLGGRSPRSTLRDSLRLTAAFRLNRLRSARIALLAVRPAFAEAGAGSLMAMLLAEQVGRLRLLGVTETEVSLVDPTDVSLVELLRAVGAERYKSYRFFEKHLNDA